MQLKADPLRVFASSDSPIALHVRLTRMDGSQQDRAWAERAAVAIRKRQAEDGCWNASAGATINELFALWLLGSGPDAATGRGVDWLLETRHPLPARSEHPEGYDRLPHRVRRRELRRMQDVPFTMGCSNFVKSGAALFLAAAFGQGDAARIRAVRDVFSARARQRDGRWCSGSCANNVLQGFAMDAGLARGAAMRRVLAFLAGVQSDKGGWGDGVPFYPTVYALARVPGRAAKAQLDRAVGRLVRTQNRDGSWGRTRKELCTYLALGALERAGLLPAA
jgi:hypothetical protein